MSELQLSLLALGALCLLGVLGLNWWQMRRSRSRAPILPDPLTDTDARIEPGLGDLDALSSDEAFAPTDTSLTMPADDAVPAGEAAGVVEGNGAPGARAGGARAFAIPPLSAPEPVIDPLIDCIVPIELFAPVSSDRLLPQVLHLRRAGNKPVHVEGLHWESGRWEPVRAGQRYTELQLAVQLANRSGALHPVEYSEFAQQAQKLAEALDGQASFPDNEQTLQNARELDDFAQQCDVQLGINLEGDDKSQPWSAALIQSLVTEDGLVMSRDGSRFNWYAEAAGKDPRLVFSLLFAGANFLRDDLTRKAAKRVSLVIDVPRADPVTEPLRTMWSYAAHLAQKLGARIVDDQGRPLTDATIAAIDAQLAHLFARLKASGIDAGSAAALRLFSD